MADCGPINAFQQVAKHSQQDRSLQQDRVSAGSLQHQNQQLRSLQHSQHLENEFVQRQQSQFHVGGGTHFQPQSFQLQQGQYQQQGQSNRAWANDFAKLSLNSSNIQAQQQGPGAWNQQFLQTQSAHLNQTQHQSSNLHQYNTNQQMPMMMRGNPQLNYNQTTTAIHSHRPSEHAEVYHLQKINNHIEEEFQRLEASLAQESSSPVVEQEPINTNNHNTNLEFQKTAKDITKAMSSSSASASKFQNSKFLNLMQNIGSGEITLNNDESKLINTKGEDIHELAKDTSSSSSHLPDPLEGLSKEDITSPFETAQKVAEKNGHSAYSWDEHYDDYRNGDTEF